MPPGTLTLSFDTELGWGAIENGLWRRREASGVYERTREALRLLLKQMDALEIPATWALVGGLLERPGRHDLDHLPAPACRAAGRALAEGREGTFYGPDIAEAIATSRVGHELGSHTYSHTRFSYPGVDADFVREDLSRFLRALPAGSGRPESLVFPHDAEGFVDEVAEAGMGVYRGSSAELWKSSPARLLSAVLKPPPYAETVEVRPGLRRTTSSMFFNPGYRRLHRLPLVSLRAERGLRAAARTGCAVHIYNHPWNFGEVPGLLPAFELFLRRAARYRDEGRLKILTMAELR